MVEGGFLTTFYFCMVNIEYLAPLFQNQSSWILFKIFFCIICNTYICCWTTEELRSSGKLTHHYAKLKLCFTIDIAIHVSAFLKIQFSSFELPNWSIVNGTREFYMRMITLYECGIIIYTTVWIDGCSLDVGLVSITTKPYILQKF